MFSKPPFSFYLIPRSYTVSDEFLVIDGLQINFDFVATPTAEPRKATIQWNHFFKRIPWDIQQHGNPSTSRLTAMEIVPGVTYFYEPIAPFDLSQDGCYEWLDWHVHTLVDGNDIHALRTRDPAADTSKTNMALNRDIGTTVNYQLFYSRRRDDISANPNSNSNLNLNRRNRSRSPINRNNNNSNSAADDDGDDNHAVDQVPVTARYLRESLDRQYDRFRREFNREMNRFANRTPNSNGRNNNNNNYNNGRPYRQLFSPNNDIPRTMAMVQPTPPPPPPPPSALQSPSPQSNIQQLQSIAATHTGNPPNTINIANLSNDDLLSLIRNRDHRNNLNINV